MAADSKLIQEQKENHEELIQYNVSYADVSQFSCWTSMLVSGFRLINSFQQKEWVLKHFCHHAGMADESSLRKGRESSTLVRHPRKEHPLLPLLGWHLQS